MAGTTNRRLATLLGTFPKTKPLKAGEVRVDGAELEFAPLDHAVPGFRDVVRELKFDVAELALGTFLQAKHVGKPYLLLPFVMNAKFHHRSLLRLADRPFKASALGGRKVALRAYAQTTPIWVRGFLMDQYGLKLDDVEWLTQNDGHVAECDDPAWVTRMPESKDLFQMLLDGDADAIIFGAKREPDPRFTTVLDNPAEDEKAWGERHGCIPINHMVTVREELARDCPDLVRNIFAALIESRRVGEGLPNSGETDLQPYGFEGVRPGLEVAIRYGVEQGLIPRPFSVEELYGPVLDALDGME